MKNSLIKVSAYYRYAIAYAVNEILGSNIQYTDIETILIDSYYIEIVTIRGNYKVEFMINDLDNSLMYILHMFHKAI